MSNPDKKGTVEGGMPATEDRSVQEDLCVMPHNVGQEPSSLDSDIASSGSFSPLKAQRPSSPPAMSTNNAKRLIYRNKRYLEATLQVAPSLLDSFSKYDLFPEDKITELRSIVSSGPAAVQPCLAVNEPLVKMAMQLTCNKVDVFLFCLEGHQPEIPFLILGGKTLKEVTQGKLSGKSETGALLSLSGSGTSQGSCSSQELPQAAAACPSPQLHVDYGLYPEPEESFEASYASLVPQEEPEEAMDEGGLKKHYVGSGGGCFQACDGSVEVSIPRDALSTDEEVYVMDAIVKETVTTETGEPVYLGKALFFGKHGLQFDRRVSVTVHDDNISTEPQKVYIFRSNTSEDELPEFEDVTDACAPKVIPGSQRIVFYVKHFSIYLYALAAARSSVAAVHILPLLSSREARVYVAAKAVVNPQKVDLQVAILPAAKRFHETREEGYVPVNDETHRKLLLACYERRVYMTFSEPSNGLWKMTHGCAERLEEGMDWDSTLYPLVLEREGSDDDNSGVAFPFDAGLTCETEWHQKRVDVKFRIDRDELQEKAVQLPPRPPQAKQPPPPPCQSDHSAAAKRKGMSKERKTALAEGQGTLARDTHINDIPGILDQLLTCGVLHVGTDEYSNLTERDRTGMEKMRYLMAAVGRRYHSAFDCFLHAVTHVWYRPYLAEYLVRLEQEAVEAER